MNTVVLPRNSNLRGKASKLRWARKFGLGLDHSGHIPNRHAIPSCNIAHLDADLSCKTRKLYKRADHPPYQPSLTLTMEATLADLQSENARLCHELHSLAMVESGDSEEITVADYLLTRLEQLGVTVHPPSRRTVKC